MKLAGANRKPQVAGLDELAGRVNYFVGSDRKKWRTNIATYAKIKYENVYPGVDLVYHGNQRELEYDFVLEPGADPKMIRTEFQGADRLEVDGQGDLVLHVAGLEVRQHKPTVYQEVDGIRQEIPARYSLEGKHNVGFQVGPYDAARPLVIDPVLSYSTFLGGSGEDSGNGIAVDTDGNAYVTGYSYSTDFPTASAFGTASSGVVNAFVAKLNATGSALVYSTYLGGSDFTSGNGIAVEPSGVGCCPGDAYVTGTTTLDFPIVGGSPFQSTHGGGGYDAFVAKLDAAGILIFSTYLGGGGTDAGAAVAVDNIGAVLVTGTTSSMDFPNGRALLQPPPQPVYGGGPSDAFVARLNDSLEFLTHSTYLGGSGEDAAGFQTTGVQIAVESGNVYVTGRTNSTNFPTESPIQPSPGGGFDTFVTKLRLPHITPDPNPGGSLVYSTYLGGADDDAGFGIAIDADRNAYVTGYTYSSNFPTAHPFQPHLRLGADAFVAKLNPAGSALVYSTYLGGSNGAEFGLGIAVDGSGSAFVTGATSSTNFPTVSPIQQTNRSCCGGFDVFVTKMKADGSAPVYSTYLGGSGSVDLGRSIAVDADGSAYVTGVTDSADFPLQNPFQPAFGGITDTFVAKLSLKNRSK